jgi:4-hydroxy-tetrahydrodipicolinate synthase
MSTFKGTGVAIVTPFDKNKNVDVTALRKLVNYLIDGGVEYLVVLGTTGESATLNPDEKKLVIDTVVEENNNRLPLVLGIGGNNTQAVIEQINRTDLSLFEAVLSVSPYYNKPTQEGIYQHYKAIMEQTDAKIILYNVPGRTASNITAETTLRLAHDFNRIIAIKEASGNLEQAMKIINGKPDGFYVISGDDALTLPFVAAGGDGVISVIANALPKDFSDMVRAALNNDMENARKLHYKVFELIDYLFAEGNPAGIKNTLAHLGIMQEFVRLPLVPVSKELSNKIKLFLDTISK